MQLSSTIQPYRSLTTLFVLGFSLVTVLQIFGDEVYVHPEKAHEEQRSFRLQGEYRGKIQQSEVGLQVLHVTGSTFHGSLFSGGLPDGTSSRDVQSIGNAKLRNEGLVFEKNSTSYRVQNGSVVVHSENNEIGRLERVTRTSPTLGKSPPEDAVHLFDGSSSSLKNWNGGERSGNGFLKEGTHTRQKFGDFRLHMEFRLPYKPGKRPSNQDRGNSGVYIYDRYEIQLLETFGLPYYRYKSDRWKKKFKQHLGYNPQSGRSRWCGAFYAYRSPRLNATYPPLTWQTFDVEFRAPRIENGEKVKNARVTVWQNGIKTHERVLEHGTGAGKGKNPVSEGGIYLQDHGNPIRFRNIWIVEE